MVGARKRPGLAQVRIEPTSAKTTFPATNGQLGSTSRATTLHPLDSVGRRRIYGQSPCRCTSSLICTRQHCYVWSAEDAYRVHEVPEARLRNGWVGREELHAVRRRRWLCLGGSLAAYHLMHEVGEGEMGA